MFFDCFYFGFEILSGAFLSTACVLETLADCKTVEIYLFNMFVGYEVNT